MLLAAENGYLDVVRFLAEGGAAKDQADIDGKTPLWFAARNGVTPLSIASQDGYVDIVRFLADGGAAKDHADIMGVTLVGCSSKWPPRHCAVSGRRWWSSISSASCCRGAQLLGICQSEV